jgi:preprotein translocase subunit SecD
MLEYSRWKYLVILLVLALSVVYAVPNAFPQDPAVQVTANRGSQVDAALKTRVDAALKKQGVPFASSEIGKDGNLLVRTATDDAQTRAADVVREEVGSGYVVALNQASTVPGWLRAIGARPMFLGLDLRGGVHFLMQVDREAALAKRFEATAEDMRVLLRDNRIRYNSVEPGAGNTVVAVLSPGQDLSKVRPLLARDMPTYQIEATADRISVRIPQAELDKMLTDAVQQNIGTLSNRINELGVAEPIIQRQGADRIAVQLPGVQDTAQAKRILGATATLEYRGVVEGNAVEARESGNVPPEARIYNSKTIGPDGKPLPVLLNKRIITSGEQLQNATSFFDSQSGTPAVSVRLNSAGGQRMFDYTSDHVGKSMAVVYIERVPEVKLVDGKEVRTTRVNEQVISVATIQSTLGKRFPDHRPGEHEGRRRPGPAAARRRAGGADGLRRRTHHRPQPGQGEHRARPDRGGVLLRLRPAVLPGVLPDVRPDHLHRAADQPADGVRADVGARRDHEPARPGRHRADRGHVGGRQRADQRAHPRGVALGLPPQKAIAEGYERASGTILDANVTAFLAGLAMFAFGSGPLKGFGMTTMLGIATSAYTAVSVSRGIATLIYGGRKKLKSVAI